MFSFAVSNSSDMANQNYFTSSAANPVELAEKNLPFYNEFVASWGSSSAHRELWPGQNLAAFIYSFIEYAHQSNKKAIVTKASKLQVKFAGLYQRLTGFPYTVHSPKSTIATS
jgi:hypothetical protein